MRALRVFAVLLIWFPAALAIRQLEPPTDSFAATSLTSNEIIQSEAVRIDSRGGGAFDIGSGTAIGAHLVLTNAHLTTESTTFVTTCDRNMYPAEQIQRAADDVDLAIVVTSGPNLVPIQLADDDPSAGESVTTIGYPSGVRTISNARIEGTIKGNDGAVLRFSPEPHPGQSGSPLIDSDGRLVGIAYAEDVVGGQGLAIPVSRIRAALDQWRDSGVPGVADVGAQANPDPSASNTCG
jgi:S1-C subfamily serine protease